MTNRRDSDATFKAIRTLLDVLGDSNLSPDVGLLGLRNLPHIRTMALFRLLSRIEERFDQDKACEWMGKYWYLSIIISMVYLALVFFGKQIMKNRPAFQMRRGKLQYIPFYRAGFIFVFYLKSCVLHITALTMWSAGLAAFSVLGSITLVPELVRTLIHDDFYFSVCKIPALKLPPLNIWAWFFILSKCFELGDTAFIVLRKTPLSFLHWYHHVTVFIYTWFANSFSTSSGVGMWFACMNYSVHSLMYGYYAIKATGRKIPLWISQVITVLQLSQMFVAIICNAVAYHSYHSGKDCDFQKDVFQAGMVIYGTYALLFLNFFYQRHVNGSKAE